MDVAPRGARVDASVCGCGAALVSAVPLAEHSAASSAAAAVASSAHGARRSFRSIGRSIRRSIRRMGPAGLLLLLLLQLLSPVSSARAFAFVGFFFFLFVVPPPKRRSSPLSLPFSPTPPPPPTPPPIDRESSACSARDMFAVARKSRRRGAGCREDGPAMVGTLQKVRARERVRQPTLNYPLNVRAPFYLTSRHWSYLKV